MKKLAETKQDSLRLQKLDSLQDLIELWEEGMIEVPGFEHEHHHEKGEHHSHKPAPQMTDESMLEYQLSAKAAIEALQKDLKNYLTRLSDENAGDDFYAVLHRRNRSFDNKLEKLADVEFTRKLNKEVSMYFLYPTFGPTVKALQGKEIQIKGYIIPVDENENIYVVSAQPMAMCFFCGGSGPESIMELQFKNKKQRFKTDEVRTVKGVLQLNPTDIEHLNYILKNAEVVE